MLTLSSTNSDVLVTIGLVTLASMLWLGMQAGIWAWIIERNGKSAKANHVTRRALLGALVVLPIFVLVIEVILYFSSSSVHFLEIVVIPLVTAWILFLSLVSFDFVVRKLDK